MFVERRFDAPTIELLSDATSVPTSTRDSKFDRKQEILAFLVHDWLDRTADVVEAAATDRPATVRLRQVIESVTFRGPVVCRSCNRQPRDHH